MSFIVGAVGVGAGAYFIFSSGGSEKAQTALATTAMPGGGAVSLVRTF